MKGTKGSQGPQDVKVPAPLARRIVAIEKEKLALSAQYNLFQQRQVMLLSEHWIKEGRGPFDPEAWILDDKEGVLKPVSHDEGGGPGYKPVKAETLSANATPLDRAQRRAAAKKKRKR